MVTDQDLGIYKAATRGDAGQVTTVFHAIGGLHGTFCCEYLKF